MDEPKMERRENYIDESKWHLARGINPATLLALAGMVIVFYSESAVMKTEIESLRKQVEIMTDDRIHSATVREMFQNKDLQIENLRDAVDDLSADVDAANDSIQETNKLLNELLRKKVDGSSQTKNTAIREA